MKARLLQFRDKGWKIGDFQHDAVPPAGLLLTSVRHGPRPRGAGTAQENLRVTKHDVRERGELLMFEREPEVLRVEHARASHIRHLIANAMNRLDECMWRGRAGRVLRHDDSSPFPGTERFPPRRCRNLSGLRTT